MFLRSGTPYIDLLAKDNNGEVALTFLLHRAVRDWRISSVYGRVTQYIYDFPPKIATLLQHGAKPRSEDRDGLSCLHICLGWFHPAKIAVCIRREMLECLCILINSGADVHAVSSGISVTEVAHESRAGKLWEDALESCGFDVDQVYASDHNKDLKKSSDLYAPTDQYPRRRGPMDNRAYHDKCWKELQGCVTVHVRYEACFSVEEKWSRKCRWPNGMIHDLHNPYNEASDDNSSEQEEDNRACPSSDRSEYNSDTEDSSDEEMGGVPI